MTEPTRHPLGAFTCSEETDKLASAFVKAQAQVQDAQRNAENPHFGSRYADLASTYDACRKALEDQDLAVLQGVRSTPDGDRLVTRLIHGSGQWIEDDGVPLLLTKQDMQGLGSALTYARRYGLSAQLGIAPEDDDGNRASGNGDGGRPVRGQRHAAPDNPADMVVPFGKKHKGKTIGTIWQSDPGYVEWLAKECKMDDVRQAATEFLQQVNWSGKKTRTEQFEAAAKEAGWEADDAATQTGAWIKETFGAANAGALSDEEFGVTLEWVRNAGSLPPDYLKEAELSDEVLEALSGAAGEGVQRGE